jgi:hypothetical protein
VKAAGCEGPGHLGRELVARARVHVTH